MGALVRELAERRRDGDLDTFPGQKPGAQPPNGRLPHEPQPLPLRELVGARPQPKLVLDVWELGQRRETKPLREPPSRPPVAKSLLRSALIALS